MLLSRSVALGVLFSVTYSLGNELPYPVVNVVHQIPIKQASAPDLQTFQERTKHVDELVSKPVV